MHGTSRIRAKLVLNDMDKGSSKTLEVTVVHSNILYILCNSYKHKEIIKRRKDDYQGFVKHLLFESVDIL